jgi:hypothetical protein
MAMVCPKCSTFHEQRLQCPSCGTRLLYRDLRGGQRRLRLPGARWQQTPWGRILIGLILAQGLFFGLRQMLTGVLLAVHGDDAGSEVSRALYDLAVLQTLQVVTLLVGCILAGSGQRAGIVLGALVGIWNGVLTALVHTGPTYTVSAMSLYVQPLLHTVFGAVGGWIGCVVWRPLPTLTAPDGAPQARKAPQRRKISLFAGRVAWLRVLAGAALAVAGTLSATLLLRFALEAGKGKISIPAEIQDRVFTWEIQALALLLGGALAGATTANGTKQGLFVGVATSMALVALQSQSPQAVAVTVACCFSLTLLGGWFGGQLFPPVVKYGSTRGLGPASV